MKNVVCGCVMLRAGERGCSSLLHAKKTLSHEYSASNSASFWRYAATCLSDASPDSEGRRVQACDCRRVAVVNAIAVVQKWEEEKVREELRALGR